jgi:hypothetical protein
MSRNRTVRYEQLQKNLISNYLSLWPRGLRSRVQIPLEAWMCVRVFLCCAVLCSDLATSRSPGQGDLMNVQKQIHKFQKSNSESDQARGSNPNLLYLLIFYCFLSTP